MFGRASEAVLHIGVTKIVGDLERLDGGIPEGLEAIAAAVYSAVSEANEKHQWPVSTPDDDDTLFRIGTGAILVALTRQEDYQGIARVEHTIASLRALGAAVSGTPVDWEALMARGEGLEPAPLQKWFEEAKRGTG